MKRFRDFLKRKYIEISLRRYGIDALGAMAQGLFCSLLIGTILNTLGQQFHIGSLNAIIFTLGSRTRTNRARFRFSAKTRAILPRPC